MTVDKGKARLKMKKRCSIIILAMMFCCLFQITATAKVKEGIYQKVYTPQTPVKVYVKPFDGLAVLKVHGGKIKFLIDHGGVNGSPYYSTPVITAKIKNGKVKRFKWKDSWGNSGTGSMTFKKNKVTIKMNTKKIAKINRWLWWKKVTLKFKTSKITSEQKKYFYSLKY